MPLFRAIGIGVLIIVLRVLAPEIYSALEQTLLTLLQVVLGLGEQLSEINISNMASPQVPGIPR